MYRWVRNRHMIGLRGRNFVEAPWAGGVILLACVIIAMLLANLPVTKAYYHDLLETDLSLMVHSPDGLIDWLFPRGMTVTSRGTGLVRVLLEDVPEGRYRVYFDYYEKENGAEFSVWQRQRLLSEWRSSKGEGEKLVSRFYAGDIVLTPQTNSISFQIRGNNYRSEFEFANIYLEKISE